MTLPFLSCPALGGCGDPGDPIDFGLAVDGASELQYAPPVATARTALTLDIWLRNLRPGTGQGIFRAGPDGNNITQLYLNADGTLTLSAARAGVTQIHLRSSRVLRDPGEHMHVHAQIDTTQATASDRAGIWINGDRVTDFVTEVYGAQGSLLYAGDTVTHRLLTYGGSDGLIGVASAARVFLSAAVPVEQFGYLNYDGHWVPRRFTGAYGARDAELLFANPVTLGADTSGNGNNWTPVNLAPANQVTDTPTDTALCLNPLEPTSQLISLGGRRAAPNGTYASNGLTDRLPASGRFALAYTCSASSSSNEGVSGLVDYVGDIQSGTNPHLWSRARVFLYPGNGDVYVNATLNQNLATIPAGTVIEMLIDCDTKQVAWRAGGADYGAPVSFAGLANPQVFFSTLSATVTIDFGRNGYVPPAGYDPISVLSGVSRACPEILAPDDWFTIRRVSGGASVADLPWNPTVNKTLVVSKREDSSASWQMVDTVGGAGFAWETDDATAGLVADPTGLVAFTANGYTVGASALWQGTRTDEIYRAGRRAGFDILDDVEHVNGVASTVPHAAGGPIDYAWVVRLDAGADRRVFHRGMSAGQYLRLNSVSGPSTDTGWFTSTANDVTLGASMPTGTYRLYVWRAVPQFSAFPFYTGNGSADGPMLPTDFAPRKIDTHRLDGAGNWYCLLPPVAGGNPAGVLRYYEVPAVPAIGAYADLDSNGVKIRNTDGSWNTNGSNTMAAMWAAAPAKFARAR